MITYKGIDGSNKDEAVIILGAKDETKGVDAEYNWIKENYGEENVEREMIDQELINGGDKQYDILRIKFSDGKMKTLWFDITDFYGK